MAAGLALPPACLYFATILFTQRSGALESHSKVSINTKVSIWSGWRARANQKAHLSPGRAQAGSAG